MSSLLLLAQTVLAQEDQADNGFLAKVQAQITAIDTDVIKAKVFEQAGFVADLFLKFLEFTVPYLTYYVGWVRILAFPAFLGYCGYQLFKIGKAYLLQGKSTDYSILVRNGEMVKQGIGLSTWSLPGDKMVSFPAHIRSISFDADQVTNEMQGVTVRGQLFYSVYRIGEGPLLLWKAFGTDLQQDGAPEVSRRLRTMTTAVIRDKIANSTIEELLKKRDQLRTMIKKDLAEKMKEWGMWLETVEIADVVICSDSLFSNMQAETKENKRFEAHMITTKSNDEIRMMEMKNKYEYATASAIRSSEESKLSIALQAETDEKTMNFKIKEQADIRKLEAAKHQTTVDKVKAELKITEDAKNFALDEQAKEYKNKDEYMTEDYLAKMKREAVTEIWRYNQLNEMKFVNVGEGAAVQGDAPAELVKSLISSFAAANPKGLKA